MTDLVQIFEDAATDAGYEFAYGAKDILNYEAGKNVTLTSGEYVVMVFPMVETANVVNSAMNGFSVSTQIWIGRKFDTSAATGTKATIDETERQKYNRRLKALRLAMDVYIKNVFCSTDLELISARIFRELNKFATNIDFMTAEIVFKYDQSLSLIFGDEPVPIGNQTDFVQAAHVDLQLSNPIEIEFWYYYANKQVWGDTIGLFEVQNDANNYLLLRIGDNTQDIFIFGKANGVGIGWGGYTIFTTVPAWYKIKLTWSGTTMELYCNDALVVSTLTADLNTMVAAGATLRIMNDSAGGSDPIPAGHKLRDFSYITNNVLIGRWIFCEESGNIVYNVISNTYHAVGQVGFNTIVWERSINDDKYLNNNGYRKSGLVYIPALTSGASAADGNALTNVPPDTEFY